MKFQKYHGLGNDFIMIPYLSDLNYSKIALKLCNRNIGIGADGLIAVKTNPLEMIYYNQDGSRASMCGNGIRCFAAYCLDNELIKTNYLEVETLAGKMVITVLDKQYRVNMRKPIYNSNIMKMNIPFQQVIKIGLENVYPIFMGTIHTVILKDDLNELKKLQKIGETICNHSYFVEKTNVNFVKIIDKNTIEVLTYERGVGFTLACGTGCCASAVIVNKYFNLEDTIIARLKYGNLIIEIKEDIFMSGKAVRICKGEIDYV